MSTAPAPIGPVTVQRRRYPRQRRRWKPSGWSILGWVYLILLLIFTVVPMAWMLSTSLKIGIRGSISSRPSGFRSTRRSWQYRRLLHRTVHCRAEFLRYLRNSLWVSFMTTVLGLLVAVPAAYAFSRFSFPGRATLFFSVLVRNMFPIVVFLIPLFILMRTWG